MAKKIHKIKGFQIHTDSVQIDVDMSRVENNLNRAQFALDSAIMTSMIPFMPQQTGQFINETQAESAALAGTGKVVAAAPPQGRYLYEGVKMVDAKTGKGPMKITDKYGGEVVRWKKGTKLKPTNIPLTYSRGSAQSHWFEPAKEKDGDNWVKLVQKEMDK